MISGYFRDVEVDKGESEEAGVSVGFQGPVGAVLVHAQDCGRAATATAAAVRRRCGAVLAG